MKKIFLIGAGRSSSYLIDYLLKESALQNWHLTVGDIDLELVKGRTKGHTNSTAIVFDVNNNQQREKEIKSADLVISMLPAFLHGEVAKDCVKFGKHLVTASYVSDDMKALDAEAKKKGIILLNEVGLDPGIDHASAMRIINNIKERGGKLKTFKSYCGGLVAPEFNDNPWGYKFSWNPRNVVLAGQGTAQYIDGGKLKFIPYHRLFLQTEEVEVSNFGMFEAYANRDSVSYKELYGLSEIQTMLRGTFRMPGYCKAWNAFVSLGLVDDTWVFNHDGKMTWPELLEAFLPDDDNSIEIRMRNFLGENGDDEVIEKLNYLGIFEAIPLELNHVSPAKVLQHLLEKKWKLKEHDKDMVVMQHYFEFDLNGLVRRLYSSLVVKGEDQTYTAMAKTVGLPLAISVKHILIGNIKETGVHIPVSSDIYDPLLNELEEYGIVFNEKEF